MADCQICALPVVTHHYVRAKSGEHHVFIGLIPAATAMSATAWAGSCKGHLGVDVAVAIQSSFVREEYPLRLLWSPELPAGGPLRARGALASTGSVGVEAAVAALLNVGGVS
jgi:hypothetical protein